MASAPVWLPNVATGAATGTEKGIGAETGTGAGAGTGAGKREEEEGTTVDDDPAVFEETLALFGALLGTLMGVATRLDIF
jgi:hypothetical protein